MPRLIKYMGSADIRKISRGETVEGTLSPFPDTIFWKRSNNWIVDAEKIPDVPAEWWDYLVESGDFADVTDAKVKPLNKHQEIFLAMGKTTPAYNKELDDAFNANAGVTVVSDGEKKEDAPSAPKREDEFLSSESADEGETEPPSGKNKTKK
jgi:hypothetical protein